jgi:2,5-diketo-D-gluconate reductase A
MALLVASLLAFVSLLPTIFGANMMNVTIAPGVHMPMIAFGSATSSFKDQCSVQEAVEQWLHLGGRHIDTAWNYHTQPDVGRALKSSGVPRKEVFLTTKIPGPIGKQKVIDTILKESLPQLGLEYIDLLLIHYPCEDLKLFPNKCGAVGKEARLDTWQGLMELQKAGKIRAAGVSNYDIEQVSEIIETTGSAPAVNQVEWHLGYHNETLLAGMKGNNVTLEAWASLAGPTASAAGNPGISLGDARLKVFAQRHNVSTAQIALRWSTYKGVVPVTATCDKSHALGDLAIFSFDLTSSEVAELDSLRVAAKTSVVV